MTRPKILYFITEDWYFCSHRLPLALAAKDAGYDVAVVTNVNRHGEAITRAGLRLIPFPLSRRSINPFAELSVLARLVKVYKQEKPDLVHHVAMKPVVYGSLAARLTGVPCVVNALTGLGYVFTSDQKTARLLRPFLGRVLTGLLKSPRARLIMQNQDDRALFIRKGFAGEEDIRLIRGSGVDTRVFSSVQEPAGVPVVMLASRMLWAKGIREFVEAAGSLKASGVEGRFLLVGDTDPHNPSAIPKEQLASWDSEGVIEWLGHREDMPKLFSESNIVCLPSFYGEGVPKVLIEAAACGRPIVTTDTPGCREIVEHGKNGMLVPARDPGALAQAIKALLENKETRRAMGACGREIVMSRFSIETVVAETLNVYGELKKP